MSHRPPTDLRQVHKTLMVALDAVEIELQRVERGYYQQESSEEDDGMSSTSNLELEELTRWATAIRPMLSSAGLLVFVSLDQVNYAIYRREIAAEVKVMMRPVSKNRQRLSGHGHTSSNIKSVKSHSTLKADTPVSHREIRITSGHSDIASNNEGEFVGAGGYDGLSSSPSVHVADSVTESRVGGHIDTEDSDTEDSDTEDSDIDEDDEQLFALSRTMRKCIDKVLAAVPSCFAEIVTDLRRLNRHLAKYCVSFLREVTSEAEFPSTSGRKHQHQQLVRSSTTRSSLLATAITYDRQIQLHQQTINTHLSSVTDLPQRFRQTQLRLVDLGADAVDLARRTGTAHAPFLLLFPISCRHIRATIEEMRSWLFSDKSYEGSISSDVDGLEIQIKSLDGRLRAAKDGFHRGSFWAQLGIQQCIRLDAELKGIQGQEDGLVVDQQMLAAEVKELKFNAAEISYKRAEVTRNAQFYSREILREKLSEFDNRKRAVDDTLRETDMALREIRRKLGRFNGVNLLMQSERKRLTALERGRVEAADVIAQLEKQRDTCATSLDILRKILVLKRSPDVVRKLFRDRPAHVTSMQRLPGSGDGNDNFDRMSRLVASTISSDWPALYRKLPFVPHRGTATVDQDIADIISTRGPSTVLAEKALFRWRRFHTLASPEDLVSALRRTTRDPQLVRHIKTELKRNDKLLTQNKGS